MNSSSKPPESLVLFLDRSLGKQKIAAALRAAGARVEIHDDHFRPDARDTEWLRAVGEHGWVVLTKDQRIRYREIERRALMNAGVAAVVLKADDLQGPEMAQIFVKALPAIQRLVRRTRRPFVATLTRSGILSVVLGGKRGQ